MLSFCPECEREFSGDQDTCPEDGARLVIISRKEDTLVGQTIDQRYVLERRIGEGGMGAVYIARQLAVDRKVAIKILRRQLADDATAVKRFFHEAKIVSKLRHPNTITLYDFGQSKEGLLYIAMEYMTGRALDEFLENSELNFTEILEITDQVCQSLAEAHSAGIVHRDLKPENIFIDRVGSRNIVKVLDFGIAKVQGVKSNLTLTGTVFGTPAYMSPEQAQGFELDRRTDLYSLGVVLYEMLCGRLPYPGESAMKMAMAHILEPIPDLDENTLFQPLPEALSDLLGQMLAKDRDDRPESADVVRDTVLGITRTIDEATTPVLTPRLEQRKPTKTVAAGDAVSSSVEIPAQDQLVAVREREDELEQKSRTKPEHTGPSEVFDTGHYQEFGGSRLETEDTVEAEGVVGERPRSRAPLLIAAMLGAAAIAAFFFVGPLSTPDEPSNDNTAVETEEPEGQETPDHTEPDNETETEVASVTDGTAEPEPGSVVDVGQSVLEAFSHIGEGLDTAYQLIANAAPEMAHPESIVLTLDVDPSRSRVSRTDTDEVLCERTPCDDIVLPFGTLPIQLSVERRGFERERFDIIPDEDQSRTVNLEEEEEEEEEEQVVVDVEEEEEEEEEEEDPSASIDILSVGFDPETDDGDSEPEDEEEDDDSPGSLMQPMIIPRSTEDDSD